MITKPPSIAHAEFKAAALVAATALLIGAFVAYVMTARGVFEETQRLILVTDNSEGIRSGMDLSFSGFPIGRVNRVELADDGNVRILIDVPEKDAHWLRESSVFTLERSLVGDTRLRAFSAILSDPPIADGAERQVLRGDAGEQIPQVLSAVRALLDNLERMTASDSPLNATLGHVEAMSGQVRGHMSGRYGVLSGVLGGDAQAKNLIEAIERSNALLAKTDARLFGKGGVMDGSQAAVAELHGLLRDARDSLKKADAILANAEAIAAEARTATTDLGALRAEVETSLRKAGQLIDDINAKWPFARDREVRLP